MYTCIHVTYTHTQDVNFPKFLEMDLPLFEGIISDLFPGRKRPALDYGALNSVMKLVIEAKGLQPHTFFTTKVKQGGTASVGSTRVKKAWCSAFVG